MNRKWSKTLIGLVALLVVNAESPALWPAQKPNNSFPGYAVITVEKFAVGTLSTKEGFPQDFEGVIQKTAVARLAASRLFEKVIDATEPAAGAANGSSAPEEPGRLILSGTIIGYDPGSQAARAMLCCGAGATKVKVRFIFRDAQTSKEVFRTDQQGKYAGTWAPTGGSADKGTREAAQKLVEGLIKEIQKKH
jgi:hypothetical protein